MDVRETRIKNILTRTTGFLKTVTSHSMQPYAGCTFGNALCGVGCYVQHNGWVTKGRAWGSFLEARTNAAESYRANVARERRYGRERLGAFGIFMSSSTDPFVPQETRYGVTASLLDVMAEIPPDTLILQTHSHQVAKANERLATLEAAGCDVRVHLSIETDRESIPGLPGHASSVDARFQAARNLKDAGRRVVIVVAPLLPIMDPDAFFERVAQCSDAVVLDHYVGGDGTPDGRRTLATPLPEAVRRICPEALDLEYRDRMAAAAERWLPGRVGVNVDGFAGRFGMGEG